MKTWTGDEVKRFLDHTSTDRLHPVILLAVTTGMRRGEILGLRWQDTDLDRATVAVRQTLVSVGYTTYFAPPKTARSRRLIHLDPVTVECLRAVRAQQSRERLAFGPDYDGSGLVFSREDGTPHHPDRVSKVFEHLVVSSGLPRIRFHDLRHTHATLGLAAGVHPKIMSERLGHASIAFTLEVYSHAVPGLQEEAALRVADMIFNPRVAAASAG
jgi:integrase